MISQRFSRCCNTYTEIHHLPCNFRKWNPYDLLCRKKTLLASPHHEILSIKVALTNEKSSLPVWGNVFFTNTKSAFPGVSWSRLLKIWINWPTDISLGTRYLEETRKHSIMLEFKKNWLKLWKGFNMCN